MGYNTNVGNLNFLIDNVPTFVQVSLNRGLYHPSQPEAGGGTHAVILTTAFSDGGLGAHPNIGIDTITPELFWMGGLGFPVLATRFAELDRCVIAPENIASATCNLTIAGLVAGKKTVHAYNIPGDPPEPPDVPEGDENYGGITTNSDGQSFWTGYTAHVEHPTNIGMSIGLFGIRFDAEDQCHFDALGGGGGFSYTALNDYAASQTVVVDATGFVKCYLANRDRYAAFVLVVVPATGKALVSEIEDDEAVGAALWGMFVEGDLEWENLGHSPAHPTDPNYDIYQMSGTVTTTGMSWQTAGIGSIHIQVGGDLALPAGCRADGYGPQMMPLES